VASCQQDEKGEGQLVYPNERTQPGEGQTTAKTKNNAKQDVTKERNAKKENVKKKNVNRKQNTENEKEEVDKEQKNAKRNKNDKRFLLHQETNQSHV
jgi:hypothetical protein